MLGPHNSLALGLVGMFWVKKNSVMYSYKTWTFHAAKFIPERKLEYYDFKPDLNPKIKVGTRSRPDIITR